MAAASAARLHEVLAMLISCRPLRDFSAITRAVFPLLVQGSTH